MPRVPDEATLSIPNPGTPGKVKGRGNTKGTGDRMKPTVCYELRSDWKARYGPQWFNSKAAAVDCWQRRKESDPRGRYWVVKITNEVIRDSKDTDDPTGTMIVRACLAAPDES